MTALHHKSAPIKFARFLCDLSLSAHLYINIGVLRAAMHGASIHKHDMRILPTTIGLLHPLNKFYINSPRYVIQERIRSEGLPTLIT